MRSNHGNEFGAEMAPVETYFASATRTRPPELRKKIEIINDNPIVTGLLNTVGGLLAVLDENRQVLAVNEGFLQSLGVEDPALLLGLRPGNVLECIHAEEEPSGCGTTRYCSSCGAAIAIVTSLSREEPVERVCALKAKQDGTASDLVLAVRSQPIRIENDLFVLLFLRDMTREHKRAGLERTFFHDIKNLMTSLLGASEMNLEDHGDSYIARSIQRSAQRLIKEVEMQQWLVQSTSDTYQPLWQDIGVEQIFLEIRTYFAGHEAAVDRTLEYPAALPDLTLRSDLSLLMRVLSNMVLNALEATPVGGTVRVWPEPVDGAVEFHVWNEGKIPDASALRLFQRNFSTKIGNGRGVGTYSMKLFGEDVLGGKVSFMTSLRNGTEFRFRLPV